MNNELAQEVLRSMREERSRWKAPDHGWNVGLFCLRDDGLEVMQDRTLLFEPLRIRIQGLGRPGNHYSQSMELKPIKVTLGGLFNPADALLREMKALHREKESRESAAASKTLERRKAEA